MHRLSYYLQYARVSGGLQSTRRWRLTLSSTVAKSKSVDAGGVTAWGQFPFAAARALQVVGFDVDRLGRVTAVLFWGALG